MSTDCDLCRVQVDTDNPERIADFEHSFAIIHRVQTYRGRCLLILKNHYTRLTAVPADLFAAFNDEMRQFAAVLEMTFQPDHMNYAILGNGHGHIHWHMIPRYRHDPSWGYPPWPNRNRILTTPVERQQLVTAIRAHL